MILGAIFAGGQARRFGGDKGAAEAGGVPMLDRVIAALRPQCDTLVVVGRDWEGLARVDDRPVAGLGPLGALAGALAHARTLGWETVLTSGCDLPEIPSSLREELSPAPAVIVGQPLLGLWPVPLLEQLLAHLDRGERSMRGWIDASGARQVRSDRMIANINTRDDLARYESGLAAIAADRRSSP